MAGKKKAKKKQTRSMESARHKVTSRKKAVKKLASKGQTAKKKESAKKSAHKTMAVKAAGKKSKNSRRTPVRRRTQPEETAAVSQPGPGEDWAGQSGDLQGLSNVEAADSESVDELLEEGNAFEAGVVAGVESAGDSPREVRTHEVPEDDVPDEYLDREE